MFVTCCTFGQDESLPRPNGNIEFHTETSAQWLSLGTIHLRPLGNEVSRPDFDEATINGFLHLENGTLKESSRTLEGGKLATTKIAHNLTSHQN